MSYELSQKMQNWFKNEHGIEISSIPTDEKVDWNEARGNYRYSIGEYLWPIGLDNPGVCTEMLQGRGGHIRVTDPEMNILIDMYEHIASSKRPSSSSRPSSIKLMNYVASKAYDLIKNKMLKWDEDNPMPTGEARIIIKNVIDLEAQPETPKERLGDREERLNIECAIITSEIERIKKNKGDSEKEEKLFIYIKDEDEEDDSISLSATSEDEDYVLDSDYEGSECEDEGNDDDEDSNDDDEDSEDDDEDSEDDDEDSECEDEGSDDDDDEDSDDDDDEYSDDDEDSECEGGDEKYARAMELLGLLT
jgi:hypothetical protein